MQFKPDLLEIIESEDKELCPFAIVRNPYDRLYSGFQFERTANWIPQNPLWSDNLDINTFVRDSLSHIVGDQNERFERREKLSLSGIHFIQQTLLLKGDEAIGQIKEENLLRQEHVERQFADFMLKVGALDNGEFDEFVKHLEPANCSNLAAVCLCPHLYLADTRSVHLAQEAEPNTDADALHV